MIGLLGLLLLLLVLLRWRLVYFYWILKIVFVDSSIFITEGDSASGSITKSRDVSTQAVFSLRGKPLNTFGLTKKVIYLDNKEIAVLTKDKVEISNLKGEIIKKKIYIVHWENFKKKQVMILIY